MENWQISLLLFVVLIIVIGLCYQSIKKSKKEGAGEEEFEYEANGGEDFDDDEY